MICPHNCKLRPGETGRCLVVRNDNGKIHNPSSGFCSLISVEPIEKRPFFHYRPGSKYLAVGFYGCSFSCNFCQNFKVSQTTDGKSLYKSPSDLDALADSKGADGIAFTFNEPTIYHEYIQSVGDTGANIVLKTSGFVNLPIVDELIPIVSAWNVDIKGDEAEYERTCGGTLQPVLDTIEKLAGQTHLEISYLVLPRQVNDMVFHVRMRNWLASLSPDIPVHLLYFYPFHRMTEPSYRPEALVPIIELFRERLRYTYVSNAFNSELRAYRDTTCDICDRVLIARQRGIEVIADECCGKKLKLSRYE